MRTLARCLRHQEENALHLVQFIESTDCVGGFASLSLSLFLHMSMHKYARARAVHPLRADRILWLRIGWNNSVEEIYDAFFNILEKRGRINVMIGLLRWITAN